MLKKSRIPTVNFLIPILLLLFFKIPEPVYAADQSQLISSVNTSSKVIALTFDDCLNPETFGTIVNILIANNSKATFFAIGSYASTCKSQLQLAYNNGNEIDNHTYSHPDLAKLSYNEIVKEIKSGEAAIKAVIGESPKPYFRPPQLSYNATVLQAAGDCGYSKTIFKSINPDDWNAAVSSQEVKKIVLEQASPGAIVLLHASNNTNTPEVLQDIITGLKDKGYKLVTISELLNYVSVTGITMNSSTISLLKGNSFPLTASIFPYNANDKEITWKSSDENIVSVSGSGRLTGVSVGKATITAATSDGGFTASCSVTVNTPYVIPPVLYGGSDRYETAANISKSEWTTSDNVVLVNGFRPADAFIGVPLAYIRNSPVLFTYGNTLPAVTSNEITRLKAKNIYIIGDTDTVFSSVENTLKNEGLNVFRYSGNDIFETGAQVADQVLASNPSKTAVIAAEGNYPDALSISPCAAICKYPLLYTEASSLNQKTKDYLIQRGIKKVIIPGLYGSVSKEVENQLKKMGIAVYGTFSN